MNSILDNPIYCLYKMLNCYVSKNAVEYFFPTQNFLVEKC